MNTIHQYLDKYPVSPECRSLILGTIHPHNYNDFLVPFFYGNKNSIWNILKSAFPEEFTDEITLSSITSFLLNRKIGISDTIIECTRTNNSALDKYLIPTKLNYGLVEEIKNSNISTIYLTSGFGVNNAFRIFYTQILGQSITPEIREHREVILDKSIFGRSVTLIILYSPSGTANTGLVNSKAYQSVKEQYTWSKTPVQSFKIDYYRKAFSIP